MARKLIIKKFGSGYGIKPDLLVFDESGVYDFSKVIWTYHGIFLRLSWVQDHIRSSPRDDSGTDVSGPSRNPGRAHVALQLQPCIVSMWEHACMKRE